MLALNKYMTVFKPQLPIEKLYFLLFAILGFVMPLLVTIMSYSGINNHVRIASRVIRQCEARVHNRRNHRQS